MVSSLVLGAMLTSRYRVLELIAKGGMGAVYKCADTRLEGRLCAIKETTIDPNLSEPYLEQTQEQFRLEATTLATLDHPNLPKVSDYFSHRGRYYLVMDYVAGQDLLSIVKSSRRDKPGVPVDQVMGWTAQICSALQYLHTQSPPILHRDIKPANIKITEAGIIKLVDFGLVKWMAPDDNSTITVIQGLGTLAYTPLEQYGGDAGHTDPRSDIYALGATLYHLITGQLPASAKERFLRPERFLPPDRLIPDLPPHVSKAIMAATAMHPEDRPSSASEFLDMLHDRMKPKITTTPIRRYGDTWQAFARNNSRLLVFAGALLLISLLLSLGV
jgi:serine/threonine-protein kinase